MKKLNKVLTLSVATLSLGFALTGFSSCGTSSDDKTISVAASDVPHAEILNGAVKGILESKGYTLKVSTLDWTLQNDAVANGEYDANYFQHIPYLSTYAGKVELTATCKVHYEPLGIYKGKKSSLEGVTTVEICDDDSNAIRALQLLKAKGVLTGDLPIDAAGEKLTFTDKNWTSSNGVNVYLIAENLLAQSRGDYDIACLPCNTALTGNIASTERIAVEDDPAQVSAKANVLAVRKYDYLNNTSYKTKIDVLTDALLSTTVSEYVATKYSGNITCDSSSQIDLRSSIK